MISEAAIAERKLMSGYEEIGPHCAICLYHDQVNEQVTMCRFAAFTPYQVNAAGYCEEFERLSFPLPNVEGITHLPLFSGEDENNGDA